MRLYKTSNGWRATRGDESAVLPGFDLDAWLADVDPVAAVRKQFDAARRERGAEPTDIGLPVGTQEVWAAGVTYLRSKAARMEESDFSASAYDRVYEAPRPEIFFKATPGRCVGQGQAVTLRDDSKWMVPEPELTLVVSAAGKVVGYTVGNDMSCRDIEGDNTLYLPQAKVWDKCCALGPCIRVADDTLNIRDESIALTIRRGAETVFSGSTEVARIRRSFEELVGYLFRNQRFPNGVFLLTGTGIVPPDEFTLRSGDEIRIEIGQVGTLINPVA